MAILIALVFSRNGKKAKNIDIFLGISEKVGVFILKANSLCLKWLCVFPSGDENSHLEQKKSN